MIGPLHKKTIVFAGGGTGGHLYPAVALARELPVSMHPFFLVPNDRGDVERLGGEFDVETMRCPRPDRGRAVFPARLAGAIRTARRILKATRAAGVVGLGGYPALPATIAARTLRLPLYLVECNA
ncbi:MAG: glycosyltransferase, partial [Planctomycetota bacterium]|nr:glycosyltransferase [Planctomycetota bacterium]